MDDLDPGNRLDCGCCRNPLDDPYGMIATTLTASAGVTRDNKFLSYAVQFQTRMQNQNLLSSSAVCCSARYFDDWFFSFL